jgi:hypothetical protein
VRLRVSFLKRNFDFTGVLLVLDQRLHMALFICLCWQLGWLYVYDSLLHSSFFALAMLVAPSPSWASFPIYSRVLTANGLKRDGWKRDDLTIAYMAFLLFFIQTTDACSYQASVAGKTKSNSTRPIVKLLYVVGS